MKEVTIKELVNGPLKDYSLYVLHGRAIPHIIDGFKPSQRKIIYTAKQVASKKFIKTASLSGYTMALSNFHHGNQSLDDAIPNMVQEFSNNLPLLDGDGSFGSRMIPEPASPRYTFVRLSNNYHKVYLDEEICPANEDPEDPEPKFYLPIVPVVLVNGATGIATGFSTEILPRDLKDVRNACVNYLKNKKVQEIPPSFPEFKGKIYKEGNYWICEGLFERHGKTNVTITEVPVGFSREKYIKVLEKVKEDGKIVDYSDHCSGDGFRFDIKLKRNQTLTDEELIKMFNLRKKLHENITVIDQNDSLNIFNSAEDLLKKFCDYRLSKYEERFQKYIKDTQEKIDYYKYKIQFIEAIIERDFDIKNSNRKEMLDFLRNTLRVKEEYVDPLVNSPIYHLNKDYRDYLKEEIKKKEQDIEYWKNKDRKEAFIEDLKGIKC